MPIYLTKITSSVSALIEPQAASYDGIILQGRYVSAVMGALTVWVLILLGTRLYDRSVGLLAGLLLAACALHIQYSRFLAVDVPLTFFVLLALYAMVGVSREGRALSYIFAGLGIGFATATKFSALPLFVPLGVAALYRCVVERRGGSVAGRCLLAVLAAIAAFAIAEPYGLIDFKTFYRDVFEQSFMVRNAGAYPYTTQYMHTTKYVYDVTQMPPKYVTGVALAKTPAEQPHPGWITFSIDGKYAYPDGGAVIDAKTKKIAARIPTSEKLLEVDFRDGNPVQAGHR